VLFFFTKLCIVILHYTPIHSAFSECVRSKITFKRWGHSI